MGKGEVRLPGFFCTNAYGWSKFCLTDGVEKLREIAGRAAISNAGPVSFVLTFIDGGS